MAKNSSVDLSDHFEDLVETDCEDRELQALRAAIDMGLNSGQPVNGTEAFARIRAKHGLRRSGA